MNSTITTVIKEIVKTRFNCDSEIEIFLNYDQSHTITVNCEKLGLAFLFNVKLHECMREPSERDRQLKIFELMDKKLSALALTEKFTKLQAENNELLVEKVRLHRLFRYNFLTKHGRLPTDEEKSFLMQMEE